MPGIIPRCCCHERKSGAFSFKPESEVLVRTLRFDRFAGSKPERALARPQRGGGQDARNNPEVLLSRTKVRGFSFKPESEVLVRTLWFDKFAGSEFGRTLVRPAGPAP